MGNKFVIIPKNVIFNTDKKMINIVGKKFPQSLQFHAFKAKFSIFNLYPSWLPSKNTEKQSDQDEDRGSSLNNLSNKSYIIPSKNYMTPNNNNEEQANNQHRRRFVRGGNFQVDSSLTNRFSIEEQLSSFMEDEDDDFIENKMIQSHSLYFIKQSSNNCKFNRSMNLNTCRTNSAKFNHSIGLLLKPHQSKKITMLVETFLRDEEFVEGIEAMPTKKERNLFKNVKKILLDSLQDTQAVEDLMNVFSLSDPRCIFDNQIDKIREIQNSNEHVFLASTKSEISLFGEKTSTTYLQSSIASLIKAKSEAKQQKTENKSYNNQFFNFIKKANEERQENKLKLMKKKLKIKEQNQSTGIFEADEFHLQKVQKKIFGNKKIMSDQVVFKRVQNRKVIERNKDFGDNWVYAYDLPYDLTNKQVQQFIKFTQKNYGPISEYSFQPYKSLVELCEQQMQFIVPENYHEDSKKNIVKLQKVAIENPKTNDDSNKKSLTSKIIEKTKKQKQLNLNKSSMIFKFKNKSDKLKFLSHQMRLYGLNFKQMKNIKFEEAQSKKVVVLNMIPWGSESAQIIRLINLNLEPLSISVTHPNCIIAKSYIFIELGNFYQALHAKDLLDNLIFQNKRLKAQIMYGASEIHRGEYKYNLQLNHYDNLTQKLSQLRQEYNQMHQ